MWNNLCLSTNQPSMLVVVQHCQKPFSDKVGVKCFTVEGGIGGRGGVKVERGREVKGDERGKGGEEIYLTKIDGGPNFNTSSGKTCRASLQINSIPALLQEVELLIKNTSLVVDEQKVLLSIAMTFFDERDAAINDRSPDPAPRSNTIDSLVIDAFRAWKNASLRV